MQLSLYNEDNYEYFGIVDLPDDIASFLIQKSEQEGFNVEEYIRQLIMEIISDRMSRMDSSIDSTQG